MIKQASILLTLCATAALASDFRGEPLPMASCWGVYANGTAPWAPAVADPPDVAGDAPSAGGGIAVVPTATGPHLAGTTHNPSQRSNDDEAMRCTQVGGPEPHRSLGCHMHSRQWIGLGGL